MLLLHFISMESIDGIHVCSVLVFFGFGLYSCITKTAHPNQARMIRVVSSNRNRFVWTINMT